MRLKKRLAALLILALLLSLLPAAALAWVPDDPMVSEQWALKTIRAYEAWDLMPDGAQPVTVAVLDDGFDLSHEDLAANLYRDGGDVVQYNFVDDCVEVTPGEHGTHVAGIVAAVANNATGVAGVSGNYARILPVQVMDVMYGSGSYSQITAGYRFVLDYAKAHPEANIRVINMSIGGPEENERGWIAAAMEPYVNEAYDMGILTVLSAGNEADSYGKAYLNGPSDWLENAVGVIALAPTEEETGGDPVRVEWSNYNMPGQRTKTLSAPGYEILSTGWDANREHETYGTGIYRNLNGTSQASPCVAGVAAMLFAANPDLTAAEAKEILCATARPIRADEAKYVNGFSEEYGWGMVDAAAAVAAATDFLRGPAALTRGGSTQLLPVSGTVTEDPAAWSWSSSDPAVAAVESGAVTGLSAGEAVITATRGGQTLTKRVAVYDAAFTGASATTLGRATALTFTSAPVRDEWLLSVEGNHLLSLCASKGDGETVWLLPGELGTVTVTAALATDGRVRTSFDVTVLPADVADAEITVPNQYWTGGAAEPEPTVDFLLAFPDELKDRGLTDQTWTLEEGVDYTLAWENNAAPGTGTVIVSGIGEFTGTARADFGIVSDYITDDDVEFAIAPYTYDGTEHRPEVTVTCGGETLTRDVDYTLTVGDAVRAGTAAAVVQGIGRYAGTVRAEYPIAPADLSALEIEPIQTHPTFGGARVCPKVTVYSGHDTDEGDRETLKKGEDFTLTYANNRDPGTASVTVTGIGNYTGSQTICFRISDKVVTRNHIAVETPEGGFVYTGEPYEPGFTVTYDGVTLTEGTDYVRYKGWKRNVDVGQGYQWIDFYGDYAGYFDPYSAEGYGRVPVIFRITPANIDAATIAPIAPQAYTGSEIEPEISAVFRGRELEWGEDYFLSYRNNVGPGTASVIVNGMGNFTGEVTVNFTITGGDPGGYDVGPAPAEQKDGEKKDETKTPAPAVTYTDVPADAWYADSVAFVTEKGLFEGFGDGTFRPEAEMDRAMAVQVLWKLAGKPAADLLLPSGDVADGDWYAAAVRWACAVGITNGTGEGFDPDAPVTREQFAAMVYRFVQLSGKGFEGLWAFRLDFPDAGEVSDWAREGVSWLVMNGILKGMDGELNPQGVLTRAQTAALLQRVAEALEA